MANQNESAVAGAKWSFLARRVDAHRASLAPGDHTEAKAGDLLLAEVVEINQHPRLQLASGRPSLLNVGDRLVVVCGARHAAHAFEVDAAIGIDECDLASASGLAGRVSAAHERMKAPTRLRPLGRIAGRNGQAINVADVALPEEPWTMRPPVIAVCGTAVNAGKTTTAAALARGLVFSGLEVGAAKLTGTGACDDIHAFRDAGIDHVLDMTDAGLASTYRVDIERLEAATRTLIGALTARGAEVIVVEIADGITQRETAALLQSPFFRSLCDGVVFAAREPLGAAAGLKRVRAAGLVPLGLSGALTRSAEAVADAAKACSVAVYTKGELEDPARAVELLRRAIGGPGPILSRGLAGTGGSLRGCRIDKGPAKGLIHPACVEY